MIVLNCCQHWGKKDLRKGLSQTTQEDKTSDSFCFHCNIWIQLKIVLQRLWIFFFFFPQSQKDKENSREKRMKATKEAFYPAVLNSVWLQTIWRRWKGWESTRRFTHAHTTTNYHLKCCGSFQPFTSNVIRPLMGAKFKAPLDSCCFAKDQHFRLPLPSCLFIHSFALFPPLVPCLVASFIASFHYFPSPLFLSSTPLTLFSIHFFFPPHILWIVAILGVLQHLSAAFITHKPVFQIWQTVISRVQVCSQRTTSNPGYPNRTLNSALSKDNPWVWDRQLLSTALQKSAWTKNPSHHPLASFSPRFLFRRCRFHKCLTPAICSLRGLQSLPLM